MIIAFTGHRSEVIDEDTARSNVRRKLQETGPASIEAVVCGMANGFDLWAGDEALALRIPVWAAKPWAGHKPRRGDVELYAKIIAGASRVINVSDADAYPGPWIYQVRNEWMVDNATHILAYYNGAPKGGTFNCLKYADKKKKPVRNVYA